MNVLLIGSREPLAKNSDAISDRLADPAFATTIDLMTDHISNSSVFWNPQRMFSVWPFAVNRIRFTVKNVGERP